MSNEENSQVEKSEEQVAVEKEARILGWVDKDEFRGDESIWTDAETFVKRGKEINPILRENNRRLLSELDKTKKEIEEVKRVAEEFKIFQKEAYDRKLEKYKEEINYLKEAKKSALQEGDHDRVVELDDQISDTKAELKLAQDSPPAKIETKKETEALDPELQLWLDRNPWFGKDQEISQRTNTIGALLAQRNPGLKGKEFLDKLDEALAEEFPNVFKSTKKRDKPNPVESGGTTSGIRNKSNKKTFENLPDEAKAACNRMVKQGLLTQEKYLEFYEWD